MNKDTIYFDYAAATPLDKRVFADMQPYFAEKFFNPSSPYLPAKGVRDDLEQARATLAKHIGAKPGEIIFTAGATESINIAFHGVLQQDDHVVSSQIEHPAVLETAKQYPHTLVAPDEKGIITTEVVQKAITPKTKLVSVVLADSELGNIQQLKEIAQIIKKEREDRLRSNNKTPLYFHTDASQSAGFLDINVARLGVDLLTLSAAKIYGPKQAGLLWAASNVVMRPFIFGGGQERSLRSGTENVAAVIGFAKALDLVSAKRKTEFKRIKDLRDLLQKKLEEAFGDIVISAHKKRRLPNFLHAAWPGVDAERVLFLLEAQNVLVATGSACAANSGTRSHVLEAIGMDAKTADGSLRLTLGKETTEEQIIKGAEAIIAAVKKEQH